MSGWTPGPWWTGKTATGDWLVQSGDPATFEAPWSVQAGTIGAIRGGPAAEANARLIAAAPALAEALEKLTTRIAMWKRGVAEGIEVLAIAEEAEATLEAARGRG